MRQWIIKNQTKMQQNLHGVNIEKYKVTGMEDKWLMARM